MNYRIEVSIVVTLKQPKIKLQRREERRNQDSKTMAMRSMIGRLARSEAEVGGAARASVRLFSSDGKGKVLSEEERAKENVYIQKWERERLEKQKKKAEHDKSTDEKKSDKKPE
ncbi:hypothetical protein LUZ60_016042 [Juncus effusus]|nr:hypothetical protein LUZ60_016042 [Juncus effusus]